MAALQLPALFSFVLCLLSIICITDAFPYREPFFQEVSIPVAISDLAPYHVPLSNGTATLPPPTTTLLALTLGHGTQNYTCPSHPSTTPTLLGALATLSDLTPSLPLLSSILHSPQAVTTFLSTLPCDVLASRAWDHWALSTFPVIGHHFFNQTGTPVFELGGGRGVFQGEKQKAGDVVAPGGRGVDWLKLVSVEGAEGRVKEVYRVETEGGVANCKGREGREVEVRYAALYWFYGNGK